MGDADPRPYLSLAVLGLTTSSEVVVFLLLATQEEAVERWGGPSLSLGLHQSKTGPKAGGNTRAGQTPWGPHVQPQRA